MRALKDFPNPAKEITKCGEFIRDFVDDNGDFKYKNYLQEIANRQRVILPIELDDVLNFKNDEEFVNNICLNTTRYVKLLEEEADNNMPEATIAQAELDVLDVLENQRIHSLQQADIAPDGNNAPGKSDLPRSLLRRYQVVFLPLTSMKHRKLREIRADDIGHLVQVKGLVTKASDVKPRTAVCTYTCEICGSELFQDVLGSSFMPLTKCLSQRCTDNKTPGKITMQTRGSRFVKYQELKLQELPDQVPMGHIPRSMTVHCNGELTRNCGPGDIVTITGIFLTVKFSGYRAITAGLQADTYMEAHYVTKHKLNFENLLHLSNENEELVKNIAQDLDPYSRLAASIAPEIFGHSDVKKALLLQLVGGVTRELPDGMRIRGDINMCLMGDPGVAKSQLLKYIASIAPRGVYTTGKGSSGVGLTAAVVRDTVTGDLALEGGALVLADCGICCIDEFDKMDENDRTAIHEVMEQQTISIAKAGITTTLNARAAVLAAANPLYGRYNVRKSISENVDLPNSLLSRFDLLFLILDRPNLEQDTALSKHVLNVHKTRVQSDAAAKSNDKYVSPEVFKQYIALARSIKPVIPVDLSDYIVEAYVAMRESNQSTASYNKTRNRSNQENDQAVMTARQLLSILRLGQALSRLRLDDVVSHQDIDEAIRLTYASKASLFDETNHRTNTSTINEDTISQIFNIIKDLTVQRHVSHIDYVTVEATILKKGFSIDQLKACLNEYKALAIFEIDSTGSEIKVNI